MASKQIGKYTIAFKLGQGAMGVVYKAIDTQTKQEVAIKILSEELIHNEEAIGRFKREIRQALQLEHPNVVRSLDHGIFQDRHYYVMEFVRGCTLKDLLKKHGTFKEYQAVALVLQVIQGLEYAENYGIVHRDIKPDNIMFNSQQVVKISDMGLAKSQDSATKVTVKGTVLGTPQYMAPEQATGKEKIDHRADIYSLGATFYHMLTGNPPFVGKNPIQVLSKVLSSEPPSIRSIRPDISEKTEGIIKKMMAKNLELRYQHCSEVKRDLEALRASLKPCELPEVILPVEPTVSTISTIDASAGPITKKMQEKPLLLDSATPAELSSQGPSTKKIQDKQPSVLPSGTLTQAKIKSFKFSWVPSYEDIQFVKICQNYQILTREQFLQGLNRQEELARLSIVFSLSETLVLLNLLETSKKNSVEQTRIQHEWMKINFLFGKLALQFISDKIQIQEIQQLLEKSRKDSMSPLIGESLFQKGWISENQIKLLLSKQEFLKNERLEKMIAQNALQYGFVTQDELTNALNLQSQELKQGQYLHLHQIFFQLRLLQYAQIQALLRAVIRYDMIETPIHQSLSERMLSI